MSIFGDYLVEIGLDAGKDFFSNKFNEHEIRKNLKDYIERQRNINELAILSEEIDFQGLKNYLFADFLDDIKIYLFDRKVQRDTMRKEIIAKAYNYANIKNSTHKKEWKT